MNGTIKVELLPNSSLNTFPIPIVVSLTFIFSKDTVMEITLQAGDQSTSRITGTVNYISSSHKIRGCNGTDKEDTLPVTLLGNLSNYSNSTQRLHAVFDGLT